MGFSVSETGEFVGDTVTFTNTSIADDYRWLFDSSASILSNTSVIPPPVSYNTTGSKTIKLIGRTDNGCIDSISKSIYVFDRAQVTGTGSVCSFDTVSQQVLSDEMLDFHVDAFGN